MISNSSNSSSSSSNIRNKAIIVNKMNRWMILKKKWINYFNHINKVFLLIIWNIVSIKIIECQTYWMIIKKHAKILNKKWTVFLWMNIMLSWKILLYKCIKNMWNSNRNVLVKQRWLNIFLKLKLFYRRKCRIKTVNHIKRSVK